MDQECLENTYTHFLPKEAKTYPILLKSSLQLFQCFQVKMCQNLMHLTNQKSQRWIRSVQTKFIPILSQRRIKPTKNCLETVNSFVSVSIVKMCHNPMHLINYKSLRWISSVQATLITILYQKRIKPTKNCLAAVNSVVSVSMVKMYHNPMHLTYHKSQR